MGETNRERTYVRLEFRTSVGARMSRGSSSSGAGASNRGTAPDNATAQRAIDTSWPPYGKDFRAPGSALRPIEKPPSASMAPTERQSIAPS